MSCSSLIFYLTFPAGLQSDLEPANLEVKLEESPRSSVMLTPVSEVSAAELVALSPPQISPSSQLSESGSDTSAAEVPEAAEAADPTAEPSSHADASVTNEESHPDEDKDPKKSKAHLHCPVCKVTVNSVSQLEAHNSGTSFIFKPRVTDLWGFVPKSVRYSMRCTPNLPTRCSLYQAQSTN